MLKKFTHPSILLIVFFLSYCFIGFSEQHKLISFIFSLITLLLICFMENKFSYEKRSLPKTIEIKVYFLFFFIALGAAFFVEKLNHLIYPGVTPIEENWPLFLEIIVALILSEFGFYWYHRLGHVVPLLWKIHGMHHLVDKVNIGNYFYLHPLDTIFFKIFRTLPLIFIGFSEEAIYLTLIFQQTQKLLMHSNSGGTIEILNYVLISAELHRMHHSKNVAEAGNFGGVLSIWDLIFGTYRTREDKVPIEYGMEEKEEWPSTFWGLMIYPFTIKKTK